MEAGICLLLLFTPLAFGGIEMWAVGVVQILAAIVFVAWAAGPDTPWSPRTEPPPGASPPPAIPPARRLAKRILWGCIGIFVLFVLFQLTPLPSGVLKIVAPATDRLYALTIPGYAEGREFRSAELTRWLVDNRRSEIPKAGLPSGMPALPDVPVSETALPASASPLRTVSVYPFMTRERLTTLLSLIAVFAVICGHFRSRRRLNRLLAMVLGSVFAVSLFGLFQKLTWNGKLFWVREGEYENIFGPFVNRNNFAAYAVAALPLAVCLAFHALGKVRKGRRDALSQLFFSSFAAIVICGGIFYSLSRGGMIAAALAIAIIGVLLFYYGRHKTELIFLAVLFVAAGGFLSWIGSEEVIDRLQTMSEGAKTPSLEQRYTAWRQASHLIADNWLTGTGLGTFRFAFLRYAPPGGSWWTTAHNEYIELVADTGLIGGTLALAGLGAFVFAGMRPGRFRRRSGRYVFTGLVAGIVALMVHANITADLQMPAIGLIVVVLGGALLNHVDLHEAAGEAARDTTIGSGAHRRRRRRRK